VRPGEVDARAAVEVDGQELVGLLQRQDVDAAVVGEGEDVAGGEGG